MTADPDFFACLLQDLITQGHADQLRKRAETFEAARPRRGDFVGRSTPEQRAAQDRRLSATAQALRNKARLIEVDHRLPDRRWSATSERGAA